MSKGWDSNMLKKLKTLIGKGLSASEIGKRLEVSKNAVIGKLNRLGWNAKATEIVEKKSVSKSKKETKTATKSNAKKAAVKPVAKKSVKKEPVKAKVIKPAGKKAEKKVVSVKETKSEKTAEKKKIEKPVIKTASKKTKKDLALHELLIQHALQMANLKQNQCRWPIGDPDSENFHFCGETVFAGKPYCYEHCRQAYQFTPPKKK